MNASTKDVKTFPEWEGKAADELLYQCRELVEDSAFPTVRRWRDAGGRVLGHFQVYFPEEIAHAAGLLPFKLRGAPLEPTRRDSTPRRDRALRSSGGSSSYGACSSSA